MRYLLIFIFLACTWITSGYGQELPPLDITPMDIAIFRPEGRGTKPIAKIVYGRPSKKGRKMIGEKEPYGKVWRTGANETTEIKLYRDIKFGNLLLKAGTYSLYTIPGKDEWTVIFNSGLDSWGAFYYNQANDIGRIKVKREHIAPEVETFTIYFEGSTSSGYLVMVWENTIVKIPLEY